MRYKPNYCCHCGEKIERANRSLRDSKMFCDVCKHDFVPVRALPIVFAAVMALVGLFAVGSLWRGGGGGGSPNITAAQLAVNPPQSGKNPANQASSINPPSPATPSASANNAPSPKISTARPAAIPNDAAPLRASETVYFCRAETKKGTPCSRRVRGGGRCWQHKGAAPMPADEKLLAGQ